MAKRTTVTREEEEFETPEPEKDTNYAPVDEIEQYKNSIPDGCVMKIFKRHLGKRAYCGQCDLGYFSLDSILENWGGGDYIFWGTRNGQFVKDTYKEITLLERVNKPLSAPEPIREIHNEPSDSNPYLEQLNRQQELILEMIRSNGSSRNDISEIIQAAQLLSGKSSGPDLSVILPSMVSLFTTVLNATREVTTGEDPKMAWPNLFMKAIDKIGPMVATLANSKAAAAMKTNGEDMQGIPSQVLIKKGIDWLKTRFNLQKDPEFQAAQILDNLDNPLYQQMATQMAKLPFEEFGKIDPEILEPHMRPWMEACYRALKKGLEDEYQEPDVAPRQSWSFSNPPEDEGVDGASDTRPAPPDGSNPNPQ